ncbi:phosphatase PAP2 family protein [Variovorax paradoxus]|uniref:Phosphatase PAP2 family protein n=1 Tax=Variovorax paradoxus TaxID=34073 RepID=A0A5Q0LX55_VARPD|nr:phosphatase PAP2 family protein [Variovorax paradoxus]QFZ81931.1 phosphatase PAP2 family protein [Variovorax paradoxus]
MHATSISAAWLKQWLYDWGGANVNLFMFLNHAVPDQLLWLPEALSWVGSYWGAPAIVAVLLLWRRSQAPDATRSANLTLQRFVFGLVLAMSSAALLKSAFAFPRPALVLGEGVFRIVGMPDSRYSFPSGHAAYVAVLAAAIWPILGWPGRIGLLAFAIAVGWSRIALGAHFPADVVASFALGWACVAISAALIRLLVPRSSAMR